MPANPKHSPEDCPFKDVVVSRLPDADPKLDARVGRVEGELDQLAVSMREQSHNITLLGKEIGSLREVMAESLTKMRDAFSAQMENWSARVTTQTRPNWQAIIMIVGLAGALAGFVLSSYNTQLTDMKSEIKDGQIQAAADFRLVQTQYAGQLATLQDRNAQAMYDKGKFDQFTQTTVGRITELDEWVETMRAWRLTHAEEMAAFRGRVDAKQVKLETDVDRLEERQLASRNDRLKLYEQRDIDRIGDLPKHPPGKRS